MGLFNREKEQEEEVQEDEDEPETYEYEKECDNCGSEETLEIPIRTTVMDFANKKNPKCSNCGCDLFEDEDDSNDKK